MEEYSVLDIFLMYQSKKLIWNSWKLYLLMKLTM